MSVSGLSGEYRAYPGPWPGAADRVVGVLVCPILTRTVVMSDKGVDLAWYSAFGVTATKAGRPC
jgi:hypothetical protein